MTDDSFDLITVYKIRDLFNSGIREVTGHYENLDGCQMFLVHDETNTGYSEILAPGEIVATREEAIRIAIARIKEKITRYEWQLNNLRFRLTELMELDHDKSATT